MKLQRISIELAVFLMIALVAFGGFASLSVDDGSGNDLTGDWKKPKWVKQVQKTVAAPIKKVSEEMKDLVEKKSPKPVIPVNTPSVKLPIALPSQPQQPSPTCPNECAGSGSVCLNSRLPACPSGTKLDTDFKGNSLGMNAPSKNIKCQHVCLPVPKKACRIDISNCPPALKLYYKSNIISGTPDSRYDANGIYGQCLIDSSNLKNSFGNQYWKYSAPCGKILQRQ